MKFAMAGVESFRRVSNGNNSPGNPPGSHIQQLVTAPGLQAIYSACRKIYPDQPNPLQVTAVVKFWLGGPDPLDYISMYKNNGNSRRGIPPHWHYVSFGLTNLHGDGRVHECMGPDGPSGFGFELTFRLKCEEGETAPPTWPAGLLQALARYVFQSENTLCAGDHIPWYASLDGSESRIQHMMMTEDSQLQPISTPFGTVNFVQVVGVCAEELKAAQHWNGPGLLDLIKTISVAGGPWLITDMRRGETIFEIDPQLQEQVDKGIENDGSNLSGVSGRCFWEDASFESASNTRFGGGEEQEDDKEISRETVQRSCNETDRRQLSNYESEQIKLTLKKGLGNTLPVLPSIKTKHHECQSETDDHKPAARKSSFDGSVSSEVPSDFMRTQIFDAVHIKLNLETGAMLPLALRGRLKHGRHFTFKSVLNESAITLVSSSVVGAIVTEESPYAAHGPWLQILLSDDFIDELLQELSYIADTSVITAPKVFKWENRQLTITILPDRL